MILLVGKSCSGKDTIRKELNKLGYKSIVTYTTRPPRNGEVDGVDYHFVDASKFRTMDLMGCFVETTSYNVASGETWYYGSAVDDLKEDSVMIVNPEGLRLIKKLKSLNPIAFYIMADEETIWNRLRQRGDDAAEARRRLNADDVDFSGIVSNVDFCLRNDLGLKPDIMAKFIHNIYLELKGR